MMQNYHDKSGNVEFAFHGTVALFRGSEIAMVLEVIWQMTNLYGAAGIYGSLVNTGADIAYFQLGLNLGSPQNESVSGIS